MSGIKENLGQGMLRMLGKEAASKFCKQPGADLTDCVIGVIKEGNARVTKEHISRICEFANHAVWQSVFGGEEKTAGFKPARPEDVVHHVYSTGDKPAPIRLDHSDYSKSPNEIFSKTSSAYNKFASEIKADKADVMYKEASGGGSCGQCRFFSGGSCTKVAGEIDANYVCLLEEEGRMKTASPSFDYMPEHLKEAGIQPQYIQEQQFWELRQGIQYIANKMEKAATAHRDHAVGLVMAAGDVMRNGHSYDDVCKAVMQLGPEQWTKTACTQIIAPGLGILGLLRKDPGTEVFDKIASSQVYPVDPTHPLVQEFMGMQKTARELIALGTSWNQLWPTWEKSKLAMAPSSGFAEGIGQVAAGSGNILGQLLQHGGKLVTRGGEAVSDFSRTHPLAALGLGAGAFAFGKPVAEGALNLVSNTAGKVWDGLKSPFSDFRSDSPYPTDNPLMFR